jgi:hypothetical protein
VGLKIDLGCGPKPKAGFEGCDNIPFAGVKHVFDIAHEQWPFADGSVEEAWASHFVEHLTALQRIHFVNQLQRVLVPKGKCGIVVPHWGWSGAYGDPTHQWPPVSEFWFFYLSRAWREENAPHTDRKYWPPGFDCDLEATWYFGLNGALAPRNEEFKQFAAANYRDAVLEINATLTKR